MPNTSEDRPRRRKRALLGAILIAAAGIPALLVNVASAAPSPHDPTGQVTALGQQSSGIAIRGWTYDPDSTGAIKVDIYIDGKMKKRVTADTPNASFGASHPNLGSEHGFNQWFPAGEGTHKVCVYALNVAWGENNTALACKSVPVNLSPTGAATVTQVPGGIRVDGWAFDPVTKSVSPQLPLRVWISVDGKGTWVNANQRSSAVAKQHPTDINHGFTFSTVLNNGKHSVCILAQNKDVGSDKLIYCATHDLDFSPTGAVTSIRQVPGGVGIEGWVTDPDTTAPTAVDVSIDGVKVERVFAKNATGVKPGHTFSETYPLSSPGNYGIAPGDRRICVLAINAGTSGGNRPLLCKDMHFNFNPSAAITGIRTTAGGVQIAGWAADPDTSSTISTVLFVDGVQTKTVSASVSNAAKPGHGFYTSLPVSTGGVHTICAVGKNVLYGAGTTPQACTDIAVSVNPTGSYASAVRSSDEQSIVVTGWTFDPSTAAPIDARVSIDGVIVAKQSATIARPELATKYLGFGTNHGYEISIPADDADHRVCVTAMNVGTGANVSLGCKIVIAVNPEPTSAPRNVVAVPGFGGAVVRWSPPADDGGAPPIRYTIIASPRDGGTSVTASATSANISGLKSKTTYTFTVVAVNVAGASAAGTSAAVTTEDAPPPQTTPAPVSTSRYVRNLRDNTLSQNAAFMRQAGATDANANPSGHGYLMLIHAGGQSSTGGVTLSSGVRRVTYATLVASVKAYVDGYASAQKASAPAVIAISTNSDMSVSAETGRIWADQVIDPIVAYAKKYPAITIAGSDDIEPGFRATPTQSTNWVTGYLSATKAPFVFGGSADGCSWTQVNRSCNNGWTMAHLYNLAAGAAPTRIISLPQIYNTTMPKQWKYISLTGVSSGRPRINFAGALTEWTACNQAGSCGSLTGNTAWTALWDQLQSHSQLKVKSLPYSTDLRIDS